MRENGRSLGVRQTQAGDAPRFNGDLADLVPSPVHGTHATDAVDTRRGHFDPRCTPQAPQHHDETACGQRGEEVRATPHQNGRHCLEPQDVGGALGHSGKKEDEKKNHDRDGRRCRRPQPQRVR